MLGRPHNPIFSTQVHVAIHSLGFALSDLFMEQTVLLCSGHFSHYSVPIHWLVHGHMSSNNKTV